MPNPDNLKGHGFNDHPERINKNGRPKKLPDLDAILADVLGKESRGRTELEHIVVGMAKLARKNPRAAELLMDRGFGKPKQDVEQKTIIYSVEVTDDEARKLAAAILKDIM